MIGDINIKNLESKVKEIQDNFSDKLDGYIKKVNELNEQVVSNKKNVKYSNNKYLNINLVIIIFIVVFIVVYFSLKLYKPNFICDKTVNKNTYFIEKNLSVFKLVLYTIPITVGIIVVIYFSYTIYNMKA